MAKRCAARNFGLVRSGFASRNAPAATRIAPTISPARIEILSERADQVQAEKQNHRAGNGREQAAIAQQE